MATAALILLILFFIFGFFSLFFGLPGTWIILASSALYGWVTGFEKIKISLLTVLLAVAIMGEVFEYFLGVSGAKRFGASTKGATVSILGGIVGAVIFAPFLFGMGALIGLFVGAFLGAFFYELITQKNIKTSIKSGFGAMIGRVSGTVVKFLLAIGMIVSVAGQLF